MITRLTHTRCDVTIERGTRNDYTQLAALHYRAGTPATFDRILRAQLDRTLVGVLVVSRPVLRSRPRNQVFRETFDGCTLAERAQWINASLRTISRVIVSPEARGAGVATTLVRAALAGASTPWTEALAAMGHIHPFFERAGMTRHHTPPATEAVRLCAAFEHVGIATDVLASTMSFTRAIASLPNRDRDLLCDELDRFARHLRPSLRHTRARNPIDVCRRIAREHVVAPPVYYLHHQHVRLTHNNIPTTKHE